jgi:hypothetical protein
MGHDEDRVKPTTAAERNKKSNHHMQYIDNPAIRLLASALIIWRGDQEVASMSQSLGKSRGRGSEPGLER